jgi:hypothetical protein
LTGTEVAEQGRGEGLAGEQVFGAIAYLRRAIEDQTDRMLGTLRAGAQADKDAATVERIDEALKSPQRISWTRETLARWPFAVDRERVILGWR